MNIEILSTKNVLSCLLKVVNKHSTKKFSDTISGREAFLDHIGAKEKIDPTYFFEKFIEKYPSLRAEAEQELQQAYSLSKIGSIQEIQKKMSNIKTYKLPYVGIGDGFFLTRSLLGLEEVQNMFYYDTKENVLDYIPVQNFKEVEEERIAHDSSLDAKEKVQRLKDLKTKDDYSFFVYNGKEIRLKSVVMPIKSGLAIYYPDFSRLDGSSMYSSQETFSAIESLVKRFFNHVDDRVYKVIASFPIISFFSHILGWTPYLFLTSISGGTGKSNVLKLLTHLSSNGAYFSAGSRIRALARLIDSYRITAAIDEIDKQNEENFTEISGILNSGSEDSGSGYVITDTNDIRNVIVFDSFGTKYLAGNRYDVLADSTLSRTVLIMCVKADKNIPRFTGKIESKLEPEFNKIRCSILYNILKDKDDLLNLIEDKIDHIKTKYKSMERGIETAALISAIVEHFSSPQDALDVEEYLVKQIAVGMSYSLSDISNAIIRAILEGALNNEFEREGSKLTVRSKDLFDKVNSFLGEDNKLRRTSKRISNLLRKLNCLEDKQVIKDDNGKSANAYIISLSRLWISMKREPVYAEIVSDYSQYFNDNNQLPQISFEPKLAESSIAQVRVEDQNEVDNKKKIRDEILQELNRKDTLDISEFVKKHHSDFLISDIDLVVSEMKRAGDVFEPSPDVLKKV